MTRKKSADTVLKSGDETAALTDIAPTFRNSSASRRTAAKDRLVSLKELASFLDRDRNTVTKWLDHGLPYVEKADRDLGKAWSFDTAEVVRWLEKRAADATAEKLGEGSVDGRTSEDEAKRRRAVALAVVAEIDMLERLHSVVPVSAVLDLWAKDYAEIKGRMMTIPDAVAGNVDPSISIKVRKIVDEHVRSILNDLKTKDGLLKIE